MGLLDRYSQEDLTLAANTVRFLAAEGVEAANSGHPGAPMGLADLSVMLWLKNLSFNPRDTEWLDRDRFVLSNGHGSMLQYAMLHLAGYDLTIDDLKNFRQWESKTPGHPESFMTPGVECTTGPLGQGLCNAVGMAIGQKVLAARYNSSDFSPFTHKVVCIVGDGCMMEGVTGEASSVAGHLGLGNLVVFYDDNKISIAGHTNLAFTENVAKRYEAFGWRILEADGHDFAALDQVTDEAFAESDRPTFVVTRTVIGQGSPNKKNTHGVHGAALGADEMAATKKALNWPSDSEFYIPEQVAKMFADRVEALTAVYDEWQSNYREWKSKHGDLATRLEDFVARKTPATLEKALIDGVPDESKPVATRKLSQATLQVASAQVDSLIGGSADLEPSTLTLIDGASDIQKESFDGLNLRFGVREHGMGAIMNGLSYYGGFIPYGSTFLCFADYMRPAIRLAALSHLPGLFIFTHDSVFLGEDGPTHQPIEHLHSLRIMPNLHVMRPADGLETALCYAAALERKDGPCAMIFTRQGLPKIERGANFDPADIRRGAYTACEMNTNGAPDVVFVATGSEVSLAVDAAKALPSGVGTRVVSMPCWELFDAQSEDYKSALIPSGAKKVVIEAGSTLAWPGLIGCSPENTELIGIDRYGASAPAGVIKEKLGLTPEAVSKRVIQRFRL